MSNPEIQHPDPTLANLSNFIDANVERPLLSTEETKQVFEVPDLARYDLFNPLLPAKMVILRNGVLSGMEDIHEGGAYSIEIYDKDYRYESGVDWPAHSIYYDLSFRNDDDYGFMVSTFGKESTLTVYDMLQSTQYVVGRLATDLAATNGLLKRVD